MLMQMLGWAIGISVALLALAYAAIIAAMLAAKVRQANSDFAAGSMGCDAAPVRERRVLRRNASQTLAR